MARITVEDCVDQIPNRFELVMVASQRARELAAGTVATVSRDNDKNSVVSLREIAATTVSTDVLKENMIKRHQRITPIEDEDGETLDLMEGEMEWTDTLDEDNLMTLQPPVPEDDSAAADESFAEVLEESERESAPVAEEEEPTA